MAAKPGATVWRSAPTPAGASVPALRSGSVNQFVTELLAQASRSGCRVLCASATYSLPAWRTVDSDARLCFTCQKLNSCSLRGKKDDMCHLWDLKRARDSSDLGRSRIQGLKRCLSVSSLSSLLSEHLCFLCLFFFFFFLSVGSIPTLASDSAGDGHRRGPCSRHSRSPALGGGGWQLLRGPVRASRQQMPTAPAVSDFCGNQSFPGRPLCQGMASLSILPWSLAMVR